MIYQMLICWDNFYTKSTNGKVISTVEYRFFVPDNFNI